MFERVPLVIMDERVFSDLFLPEPIFREDVVKRLTSASEDLRISGPPGSGKTLCMRKAGGMYVDCRTFNTSYKVLLRLLFLSRVLVPQSGYSYASLQEKCGVLRGKRILLDGIDFLRDPERIISTLKDAVLLTSSMTSGDIELEPYSRAQLYEILRRRAELGLRSGSWSDEILHRIAVLSEGNAKRGINLLRRASELAESRGSDRIEEEDVERGKELLGKELFESLPLHKRLLLSAIVDIDGRPTTGPIYRAYVEKALEHGIRPLSQRRISFFINELIYMGLVRGRVVYRGFRGNTKEIEGVDPLVRRMSGKQRFPDNAILNF
ncbi:MAG: hypothetical protein QXK42_02790 [Candidatus Korarchaeum sp.]